MELNSPVAQSRDAEYRLVYCSLSRAPIDAPMIESILSTARRLNARDDITGMLLADDGVFIQYLEGSYAAVRACFERVTADARHHCIVVLLEEHATRPRTHSSWRMGYGQRSRAALLAIVNEAQRSVEGGYQTPWGDAIYMMRNLLEHENATAYRPWLDRKLGANDSSSKQAA
jgi:hypothetical protein